VRIRFFALSLLLIASACLGKQCLAPFNPSVNDIAKLQKTGIMRVAVHDKEPPWSWRDSNGKWTGYDIELTQFLANQLGVKARFIALHYHDFGELEQLVRNNKVDLASPEAPVAINSREYLLVSHRYQTKNLGVLFKHVGFSANHADQAIRLINDSHAVVGILNNEQENNYIKAIMPQTKVIHYRTSQALMQAMKTNRVNAIIGNERELNHWLNQQPSRHLVFELMPIPYTDKDITLVTGPKHWRLLQWINVSIAYQKNLEGGLFERLKLKYLAPATH